MNQYFREQHHLMVLMQGLSHKANVSQYIKLRYLASESDQWSPNLWNISSFRPSFFLNVKQPSFYYFITHLEVRSGDRDHVKFEIN